MRVTVRVDLRLVHAGILYTGNLLGERILSRISTNLATPTVLLTLVAMLAFAANSLLCRLALGQELIDAASFTTVRVLSGAVTLALIVLLRRRGHDRGKADWRTVAMLFTYMAFFSFAYLSLSAGTGALIFFGAVQLTMFVVALREGEHFPLLSWAGLTLALLGLIYLVSPGVSAPDPLGAVLMAVAGIAWGFYSLLGRGAADPLEATARNFAYSVPFVLLVSLFFWRDFSSSLNGLAWRWRQERSRRAAATSFGMRRFPASRPPARRPFSSPYR